MPHSITFRACREYCCRSLKKLREVAKSCGILNSSETPAVKFTSITIVMLHPSGSLERNFWRQITLLHPLPLALIFEDIPHISVSSATYITKTMMETLHLGAASQNMYHTFN